MEQLFEAWKKDEEPPEPDFRKLPNSKFEDSRRHIIYQLTLYMLKLDKNLTGLEEELLRWPVFEVLCGLLTKYEAKRVTPHMLDSLL